MCLACPVAIECRARATGRQDRLPIASPKAPAKEVAESCALVVRDGRLLLVRRGKGRLWEHFWEFPTIHVSGPDPAGRSLGAPMGLAEGVRRLAGVVAEIGPIAKTIRFGVTTHKVTMEAYSASWVSGEPAPGPGLVDASWVEPRSLDEYTLGAATRKLVAGLPHPGSGKIEP